MTEKNFTHIPVLPDQVLNYIVPEKGLKRLIDGTVGYAGHSSLILKNNEQAVLVGIDRDDEALSAARKNLEFATGRVHLERGSFSDLGDIADRQGWRSIDGVLLDLGVSSPQIDDPRRGFSHRLDGPLDMRMDRRSPNTACRFLNNSSEERLEQVLREYGEIRKSRALARAIVERRREKPWSGTLELTSLCDDVFKGQIRGRIPAATLCFQAIRMAVNEELEQLRSALNTAIDLLEPGGRIVVISFHSLEDRIVKNEFRERTKSCICPPENPICSCEHRPELKILTKKPVVADADELKRNSRAACAKLRAAEKL